MILSQEHIYRKWVALKIHHAKMLMNYYQKILIVTGDDKNKSNTTKKLPVAAANSQ